jgi:hypothetical protein
MNPNEKVRKPTKTEAEEMRRKFLSKKALSKVPELPFTNEDRKNPRTPSVSKTS